MNKVDVPVDSAVVRGESVIFPFFNIKEVLSRFVLLFFVRKVCCVRNLYLTDIFSQRVRMAPLALSH
jgi:hypothetical protein